MFASYSQREFQRDEKFYGLLRASANEANLNTTRLKDFLATLQSVVSIDSLDPLTFSRRKDKEITNEITREATSYR
jgi:hypothetical protein